MGIFSSRQNAGVEEVDISSSNAYKYPPRSGNYFGSHFIMGGERFDTPQPESYLFGENADLNFLGSRPAPFPYPPPQASEPIKTLNCLVNVRKESLRFVRAPKGVGKRDLEDEDTDGPSYNIEFVFDCDSACSITIYYFCSEEVTPSGVIFTSRDPSLNSETFYYKQGAAQQFCHTCHTFTPSCYMDDELTYDSDVEVIPIAIHCVAEDGSEEVNQSHTTIAVVDHHVDGSYTLRALKQKLFVDGLSYLLQEIYGIENKNNDVKRVVGDDETDDNGSECVICMCDVRDTLILPCRHLCLCYSCADSLRYQANNCPICRAPFRALLQIRAVQKSGPVPQGVQLPADCADSVPPGYEAISLIEALNGPYPTRPVPSVPPLDIAETPDQETAVQAAEVLNRSGTNRSASSKKRLPGSPDNYDVDEVLFIKDQIYYNPDEVQMSVLQAKEKEKRLKGQGLHSSVEFLVSRPHSRENNDESKSLEENLSCHLNEIQDEVIEVEKIDDEDVSKITISNNESEGVTDSTELEHDDSATNPCMCGTSETSSQDVVATVEDASDSGVGATSCGGEDSEDYYTPEDPSTTILSPLHDKEMIPGSSASISNGPSSVESTPGRWMGTSLPGTPMSVNSRTSNRSSADSYSSSSSTKQLLAVTGSHSDVRTCSDKVIK